MKLEIKKPFDNYTVGQIVPVKAVRGLPIDVYWRRRLKDAELDGCVQIIKEKRSK